MGALWGRVAEETSPGRVRWAAPGQVPHGPSPHSLLHLTELHADDELGLGRHILEHISLEPPQHVRPQQVVQLLDLVFLGDVSKLLQETLQVAATKNWDERQKQETGAGQSPSAGEVRTAVREQPASPLPPARGSQEKQGL